MRIIGKTEWISVKDRLPELNKDVLVWVSEDFNSHEVGRYDGRDFCEGWDTNSDLAKYRHISHWMPLPEPPK